MRSLAQTLRWRAQRHPEITATWYQGRARSYGDLERRSTDLAAGLVEALGVRLGDRVAILDKNSDDYFELLFALDKAGAVAAPINWRLTPAEVSTIARDAGAVALIAGEDFKAVAGDAGCRVIGFDELPRPAGAADPHRDREDAVTWQLYTSGTTGLPKGAMLTNLNLTGNASALSYEMPELGEARPALVAMPLYHIGGCGWAFWSSVLCGGTAVMTREVVPTELLQVIAEQRIETAFLVPAVLLFMTQLPEAASADFSSLRNIFYGASPISQEVLKRSIETFKCRFTQIYGLTETTGAITALRHDDHSGERMLSCGRPMFGAELRVVGPDGAELPAGELGEITYRGAGVMAGYYNREDDTRNSIRDGWFHSGDAGTMDAEGYFYIKDRIKDMIVSGGENIYPAELESVLAAHPAIADVAVIGVPDDNWGETVKAVVVRRPGIELGEDQLIEWSRSRLAGFKRPRSVDFVDAIPRNPSGKMLKRQLRAPYWEGKVRQVN